MPLKPAEVDAGPRIELDGVYFYMEDEDTGARVICKVSREYLDDRMAALGEKEDVPVAFNTLRSEIQDIASEQYDSGQKRPFVRAGS